MDNPYGNIVFITGASSGIGRCTAETLADEGFHVYGTSRRGTGFEKRSNGGFIRMLQMDVTYEKSVREAVKEILRCEDKIDILINCAGNGIAGAVEECSGEEALSQMDTNYAGVIRTIGAVLPSMRERRCGLIINIGSVGGVYSIPFQTLYSSSKFAVEALTQGLRIELAPFNIKAVTVQPGDIKTGFTASRMFSKRSENSAYGKEFKQAVKQMEHDEENGGGPEQVTKVILKMIKSKNPPVSVAVGGKYKLLVFLKRLFSQRTVERIMTAMYPKTKL